MWRTRSRSGTFWPHWSAACIFCSSPTACSSARSRCSPVRGCLRGREWRIAALVAGAQLLLVTVLGGAALDRYLLPVLPVLYAAIAAAGSVYPRSWRWVTQAAMIAVLIARLVLESAVSVSLRKQSRDDGFCRASAGGRELSRSLRARPAHRQRVAVHRRRRTARIRLCREARCESKAPRISVWRVWPVSTAAKSMCWSCSHRSGASDGGLLDRELVRNYLIRHWGYRPQASSEADP